MLLPALNKAREKAKSISCVNNLKQLGLGMANYIDDYDDFFPPYQNTYWPFTLFKGNYASKKLYFCPSGVFTNDYSVVGRGSCIDRLGDNDSSYQYIHYGYNYEYLGSFNRPGFTPSLIPAKIISIKNPSAKICLADAHIGSSETVYGKYVIGAMYAEGTSNAIHDRHSKGANILWVDGHVSWFRDAKHGITYDLSFAKFIRD